jgi:hypothetical protein
MRIASSLIEDLKKIFAHLASWRSMLGDLAVKSLRVCASTRIA